jgi:hypothetical protein
MDKICAAVLRGSEVCLAAQRPNMPLAELIGVDGLLL